MLRNVLALLVLAFLAGCGSILGPSGQFVTDRAVPLGGSLYLDFDQDRNGYLVLDGGIDAATAVAFENFVEIEDVDTLNILFSPGGLIGASHQMGRAIQRKRINTVIIFECYSACADVFVAGRNRGMFSDAILGMHAPEEPDVTFEVDLAYYRDLGFGTLLERSYQVPFDKMWIISAKDALRMGVATDVIP